MKILNILSSINAENSQSQRLVEAINARIVSKYPNATLTRRDLAKNQVPHLEAAHYSAFQSANDDVAVFYSDTAIEELKDADVIVIGVPVYNFNIPDTLKSWIDQIIRAGVTFSFENGAPVGLVANKKVYLAIASGGVFSEGPMKSLDFAEPYLRTILGFIGLTEVVSFRVEGTKISGIMETAFEKAVKKVSEHVF